MFFIFSLIYLIITIFICNNFLKYSYNKKETNSSLFSKYLIMNSKKIFFYYKIISLIIFYINNVVDIEQIIIYVIFLLSIINFSCFTIEYYYQTKNNNINKILYFLIFINILSTAILFIGMLLRNKNFNGLLYIFLLTIFLTFIFILININYDFKLNKNINFIKNELNAYNSLRLLLDTLENSKLNRRNKINILSYSESKLKLKNHNINDLNFLSTIKKEEFDFNFYLYIENIFKRLINRFPNSVRLICFYSLFLLEKLQRPSKSYIILCNLFYSNDNNLSNSQMFFIYILIKNIEDNYLNKNINNYKELSVKLQINYFINLLSKVCKKYIIFWNLLLDSESKKDINIFNEIGIEINKLNEKIKYKVQQFETAKIKNKKIYLLYGCFLRDILNEEQKSKKYLDKSSFYKNIENENIFIDRNIDINNLTPTSEFQYIVISAKNFNFGIILKISLDICSFFGYTDKELIGKHFNILIPEFIIPDHNKVIKKKLEEEEIDNFQNSFKHLIDRTYYFKTSSKFLVEVSFITGFIYDEDYNPIIFCKINYNNSLRFFDTYQNSCVILTDSQFYIQSMTINSMKLLNLSNTIINGNCEIISYFKEFNETLSNKLLKHPYKNKDKIRNSILNKKYLNKKEKITWLKNLKNYYINITEIKILNKLQGYEIKFDLINEDELKSNNIGKTIISNKIIKNDSSTYFNNLFGSHTSYNPIRDEKDKIEYEYLKVLNFHSNNFPTINKDYLPISKNIVFDIKDKEFFFENENSKYKDESILNNDFLENIFNEYKTIIKTNNNLEKNVFTKTLPKNSYQNIDESKEISSSFYSSLSDNIEQSNKSLLNNDNERDKKEYKNYYKVNTSKCILFIYNFNNNELIEIPKFNKLSKVEEILRNEENKENNNNIIIEKKIIKETNIKTENKLKKIKTKKIMNKKIDKNQSNKIKKKIINKSVFFFIINCLLGFLLMGVITFCFFIICFQLRNYLNNIIEIFLHLCIIIDKTYNSLNYSLSLIISTNILLKDSFLDSDDFREEIKNELVDIYGQYHQFNIFLLNIKYSISKTNEQLLNNMSIDLYNIGNNLIYNITKENFFSVLFEFQYSVFNLGTLRDKEDFNLLNPDYNFILLNYENSFLSAIRNYIDIFLNEYNKIKNNHFYYLLIIISIFFIFIFSFLIISYYVIKMIIKEKEKNYKYFFFIPEELIKKIIEKCQKFVINEVNDKNYLQKIFIPKTNIEKDVEIDSSNENVISDVENEKTNLIQYNNIQNENNVIYDKKTLSRYLIFEFIFFMILFFQLLIILLYTFYKYNHQYHYMIIYYSYLSEKVSYMAMYNYIRIYIIYYYYDDFPFISNIKSNLSNINNVFQSIKNYDQAIYNNITIYGISKNSEKKIENITKNSLCYLLNDNEYNFTCENFCNNISNLGLSLLSTYYINNLFYLLKKVDNAYSLAEKNNYYYNELLKTKLKNNTLFYPNNISLYNDYEMKNPFLLLKSNASIEIILIEKLVFTPAVNLILDILKDDIFSEMKLIKRFIVIILVIFYVIFSFIYFYKFPIKIYNLNNIIYKNKKMLKIIPKNVLTDIKEEIINKKFS